MKHSARSLQPHERLLRACAAIRVDDASHCAVDAALSLPDLDWLAAVLTSIQHGLAQCVGLHLRAFADDPRVPPMAAAAFKRMYRANSLRNAVLFREAARLLGGLETAGIPALALKGVALAPTVYPDPALRNFADMDFLVEANRLDESAEVFARHGYRIVEEKIDARAYAAHFMGSCPEDILSDTLAPEFDPSLTPEILARCCHQVTIELHRGVFRDTGDAWRRVDLTAFRQNPQSVMLPDGKAIPIPSPEAMLIHLCAHAADHNFDRLMFPLDVSLTVCRYEERLDWERVAEMAEQYGVENAVFLMLQFVREEFAAPVPPEAFRRMESPANRRENARPLTLACFFPSGQADRDAKRLQRWLLARSTRERAASLLHILCPPSPVMRRVYGDRYPLALLYLLRPLLLAGRLARVLFRRNRSRTTS
jgi:hypothetical protein